MKPKASDLRTRARAALKGNWAISIGVALVAGLLGGTDYSMSGSSNIDFNLPTNNESAVTGEIDLELLLPILMIVGVAITIGLVIGIAWHLFGGIIELGYSAFKLELLDNGKSEFAKLFSYFKHWKVAVLSRFLVGFYTFLWSLLFVIPGIIKKYSYAMTPYILSESPDLTATEAIDKSTELMKGNKWRLFCLEISFIGWSILCGFTFGIGYLWLNPYKETAKAAFYRDLVPLPVIEQAEFEETSSESIPY